MVEPVLCGITSFVVIGLLCQPYEVFGWWPPVLRRLLFGSDRIIDYDDMKWWQLALYKPLATCPKCFAGWFSLIVYLLKYDTFLFPDTIFFVAGSILVAWVLEQGKERLIER